MFNIIKSQSDKRAYYYNRLPNLLKCLLISDKDADKSAAAMNVNIGSLFDPKDFPGLAHFLEHMLFMGTNKYPGENDFSEFLNKNSGYSNAYTDLDATNYYFEVNNENFLPALDRFSQFFTSPLFNESSVEREVQAVDSENKKNLQSDLWRTMQLIRSEANHNSIFNRFATGNLETLNKPLIRETLIDFHKKYYSSHLMSLVLISSLPIEEMNKMAQDLFKDVPINTGMNQYLHNNHLDLNHKDSHFTFMDFKKVNSVPAYDKNNAGNLYHIMPVKDTDEVMIYWFIEENHNLYIKEKPLEYLSSVLGNEGPNSLTSALIKDDLITGLSSGCNTYANTYSTFYFKIHLTKKGLADTESVISRVFDAVNNLKKQPVNKRYFEEIKLINKIKFDYKSKEDPTDYASDLAHRFTTRHPEYILNGDYVFENYDENLIKKTLDQFDISKMNIYLTSRSYEEKCDLTEKWYCTKYTKQPLPDNLVYAFKHGSQKKYNHILDYPPENKFIAKSFDMKDIINKDAKFPELLEKNENREIWFKQDNVFLLPKAIIYLQIYLKKDILPTAEYSVISSIWNNILENELQEVIYMAKEASMQINFYFNLEGMLITIDGFSSALKSSAEEIISKFKQTIENINNKLHNYYKINDMKNGISDHDEFHSLLEKVISKIEEAEQDNSNFFLGTPYMQVWQNLDIFLRHPNADHQSKLKTVLRLKKHASEKDLRAFHVFLNSFLTESKFEWLIQGNITKEEALEIVSNTEKTLAIEPLKNEDIHSIKIADIKRKQNFYINLLSKDQNNVNSSIVSYFQAGNLEYRDECKLMILEALLREKFFDDLRTKQALGYIVRLGTKEHRDVNGVFCLVQSSVKSPEYLQNTISEFFKNFKWEEIDSETYDTFVNSVIVELKKKDLKLEEEMARNFQEIKSKNYKFDKREHCVELLKTIKIEEVKELFEKVFFEDIKRLDIGLFAHCHKEENDVIEKENNQKAKELAVIRIKVESANEFKRIVAHYPDFYSSTFKSYAKF